MWPWYLQRDIVDPQSIIQTGTSVCFCPTPWWGTLKSWAVCILALVLRSRLPNNSEKISPFPTSWAVLGIWYQLCNFIDQSTLIGDVVNMLPRIFSGSHIKVSQPGSSGSFFLNWQGFEHVTYGLIYKHDNSEYRL